MIMVEQFSIFLYDDEQKQVRAATWEFVQNGISDAGNDLLFIHLISITKFGHEQQNTVRVTNS